MPVVVVELLLGVVIGPHVLGLHVDEFVSFFADLGLGLLFFFAGYEIDVRRIRGHPLRLALLLLGGFAAGIIAREVLRTHEMPAFDSKLNAGAFGVFVPFFFIVSGMKLDVTALFASASGVAKMFLFFVLFFVVRGTPALLLYRRALDRRERLALAFLTSTQLPLVIAITAVAVDSGHMRPSTAAALEGAAVLSTLIYPVVGLRLRGDLATRSGTADLPATAT